MKFLSETGLESQPFKLKKGHRTLLFTIDELEQLEDDIKRVLTADAYRQLVQGAIRATSSEETNATS